MLFLKIENGSGIELMKVIAGSSVKFMIAFVVMVPMFVAVRASDVGKPGRTCRTLV
jgi:hypothetical protein